MFKYLERITNLIITKGDYTKDRERASFEEMSPERWRFIPNGYEACSRPLLFYDFGADL